MAAQLAGIRWPRGRRVHARTKVKWGAGNSPVQWAVVGNSRVRWIGGTGNNRARWTVAPVTGLPRLVAEETVSATEASRAAAHLVALARLAAALRPAAEVAPGQAAHAVPPVWAVALREAVAEGDGGGK